MIKLIFAHANKAFGNKDKLPWGFIQEDMKHFKNITLNTVCLMGKSTWDSLPSKLENRINIVLSNNNVENADHTMSGDLSIVLEKIRGMYPDKDISIIGGLSLIESCIDYVDFVYVTEIDLYKPVIATHYVSDSVIAKIESMKKLNTVTFSSSNTDVRKLTFRLLGK